MITSAVISWMLCGLIVALTARFLVRMPLQVGVIMTMAMGIAGAVAGGFIYSLIQGVPVEPYSLSGTAWHGWLAAILGSFVVLLAWGGVYVRRLQ